MKDINIKGEIYQLEFDEILKRYRGLLVNMCKKYLVYYEFEDLYQMASWGLWKAYEIHKTENGDFTNLAYQCVQQYINWHREKNRDKNLLKTAYIKEVSYFGSKEGWIESIESTEDNYKQAENRVFLNQIKAYILEKLSEEKSHGKKATLRNFKFMELIGMGYSQREIAEIYKLNWSTVQRALSKEYRKVKRFVAMDKSTVGDFRAII